jgi:hypothetical protein
MRAALRVVGAVGCVLVVAAIGRSMMDDASPTPDRGVAVVPVSAPVKIVAPAQVAAPVATAADPAAARRDLRIVRVLAKRATPDQAVLDTVMTDHLRVAAEAMPMETAMQAAFARVPLFAGGADPVHVACVRTTCEVTGIVPAGQPAAAVEEAVRNRDLRTAMLERGYTATAVTVAATDDGRLGFMLYLNDEM